MNFKECFEGVGLTTNHGLLVAYMDMVKIRAAM